MTDRHPPVSPDDLPDESGLAPAELEELRGALRAVEPSAPIDPDRRAAHLAAAMAAFDETVAAVAAPPKVVDLSRRRRTLQRLAAAAATVLVVGAGAAIAVTSNGGSDDMASEAAVDSSAQVSDGADPARDSAAAESSAGDAAPLTTAAGQYEAAAPQPATAGNDADSRPAITDLGAFPDDAALATAVAAMERSAGNTDSGATKSSEETTSTDLAFAACPQLTDPASVVVAGATVDGRTVVVVRPVDDVDPRPLVVDLVDCSARPL